jgi:hypothetical protein
LCYNRHCRPVVVELLKQGHTDDSDLQAIRDAWLVSVLTMPQLIRTRARYQAGKSESDSAIDKANPKDIVHCIRDVGSLHLTQEVIDIDTWKAILSGYWSIRSLSDD